MHILKFYSSIIDDIENNGNIKYDQKMVISCLSKGIKIIVDDQEICNDIHDAYIIYKIYNIDNRWIARIKKNKLDILIDELNGKEPLCGDFDLGEDYLCNANKLIDDDSSDKKIIRTIETNTESYAEDLDKMKEYNKTIINNNPDIYLNTRYYKSEDLPIC